ncbi:MAG: DUF3881 family protein [Lachnospiraceae bacterium]|nr:DUF3881 family protein [Lachnospiraceae bacterium]
MHQYLRSIGFSCFEGKEEEVEKLLKKMEKEFSPYARRFAERDGMVHAEIRGNVNYYMGICLSGYLNSKGKFVRQAYYPFFLPDETVKSEEAGIGMMDVSVDGSTYYTLIEGLKTGISLTAHMDNPFEYAFRSSDEFDPRTKVVLAGFSQNGYVLLPARDEADMKDCREGYNYDVTAMMEPFCEDVCDAEKVQAAALESLSKLASIDRRLGSEDIYSIVSTLCMPEVYESQIYFIIGIIEEVSLTVNEDTNEGIFKLKLFVNGVTMYVMINEEDLIGEPIVGRRFKGPIWLTSHVIF